MFFVDITSDIANYADDITPYECNQHCDSLICNFELTVGKVFTCFEYKNLKANASKCHVLVSPFQHTSININGSVNKSSNWKKLFGIAIDRNFTLG